MEIFKRLSLYLGQLRPSSTLLDSWNLTTPDDPLAAVTSQNSTVILGAGVIGLSTAYYLATSQRNTPHSIFVVDPAHEQCVAASGQATGGLGSFGFSPETAPLANFSYKLHQQLAAENNGRNLYGFSQQSIYRVSPKDISGGAPQYPPDNWGPTPPTPKALSDLPTWMKFSNDWQNDLLADSAQGSHLNPHKFCQFLRHRCEQLGVKILLNSTAVSAQRDDELQQFRSINIRSGVPGKGEERKQLPCKALVISAGPWSNQALSSLFPNSSAKIPLDVLGSAGNHIRVRLPRCNKVRPQNDSTQVFFSNILQDGKRVDFTSFLDGTIYVGGNEAEPEKLPELAESVQAQTEGIRHLIELVRAYLSFQPEEDIEVIDAGRAYRPRLVPNKPIITKVHWRDLGEAYNTKQYLARQVKQDQTVVGGLYINTGHNSDGITLGPGSGKVMSELLLGQSPSCNISELGFESL